MPRRHSRSAEGFTLVELLVVVVVLGMLASVVVFAVGQVSDTAKTAACITDQQTIKTAEEAYKAKNGTYGDENALVSAQLLDGPSSLHDVTATGGGYAIAGTGQCGVGFSTDGFEPPAVAVPANGNFDTVYAGSTFGSWTVVAGSIDVVTTAYWGLPSGGGNTQDIDLNGSGFGSISRSISGLSAGQSYTLSVSYAYNPECGSPNAVMRIRIGNLDTSVTAANSIKTTALTTGNYAFTASASSETLRFDGTGGNQYCGVVLDNINIS